MCGRYATTRTGPELERDFVASVGDFFTDSGPNYNVAPTDLTAVVLARPTPDGFSREVASGRWGLLPPWAKPGDAGLINARSETVDTKPAFRAAYRSRRVIVPMDGYYEWQRLSPGVTQPYLFTRDRGLAVAGLCEFRRDRVGQWLLTFTVLTGPATGPATAIHDRTPMLVPTEVAEEWLAPEPWAQGVHHLVPATSAAELEIRPVSRLANSVGASGPTLVEPVTDVQQELPWRE